MYPVMLDLKDREITIIGGGKVAFRKLKSLLEFEHGKVQVVALGFIEEFRAIQAEVHLIQDHYAKAYIQKSFIVIAATDDKKVNEQIAKECKGLGKLCNVVDNKDLSSFILPAYVKRGDLLLSVSTNGKSPSLAKRIKKELEKKYDTSYAEYTTLLGSLRETILKDIKDEAKKKQILHDISTLNLDEIKKYQKEYHAKKK